MKTALKALVALACAALLLWNGAQLRAIREGTHEEPIEYESYVADDVIGECREATIRGLMSFATEERQKKEDNRIVSTKVVAHYCIAILEDYSIGAVKLKAVDGELAGYDEWLIESDEDYWKLLLTDGFTIRGTTVEMPQFDNDVASVFENAKTDSTYDINAALRDMEEFNQSLEGITLLDTTTGYYPDTQTVVPELSTLGEKENIVIVVLIIAAGMFLWDLLLILAKKSEEKKEKEARAQPQQPAMTPEAAEKQMANLTEEYARVLAECSSATLTDPARVAEYALSKVRYFRSKGVAEHELYRLELFVCTNIPTYVSGNFNKVYSALNGDATPIWTATEHLIDLGKPNEAYAISKPFADLIAENRGAPLAGKHAFRNLVEDRLYRRVNGLSEQFPIALTRGNYVGLLVAHARAVQLLSSAQENLRGTEQKYLDLALKLNNVHSRAYLCMAQCVERDEPLFRENLEKALRFCCEKDGAYGLGRIYLLLGHHFLAEGDEKAGVACLTLAIHYGDEETIAAVRPLLSQHDAMELHEAAELLRGKHIQLGYSEVVREVAETLSAVPEVKPHVEHILHDEMEAYPIHSKEELI